MTLSVVILSFNVKELLRRALKSVYATYTNENPEIIVVDNASSDGSSAMVKKEFPKVKLIQSSINTGFSKGNNLARKVVTGQVVLFLNPDVEVQAGAIAKCLTILTKNKHLGAVTCRVMLPNGKIDYSCHRGLPTVWNTFSYLTGLSRLFPGSPMFAGYDATYLKTSESHHVDCASGAFLMVTKDALEKINWWDEDYFWNGEDIELCYQLKKAGYKIWYEATVSAIHYKGSSSGLWTTSQAKVSHETKKRSAISASYAMGLFVKKHWSELGPAPVMMVVWLGIVLLEKYRLFLISLGKSYK